VLPQDARFCHKCGKPQFEEDAARLAESQAPAMASVPSQPGVANVIAGISFKNARAVMITMLAAATCLIALTAICLVAPLLAPLVLCGAGFMAAKLYPGSSSEKLSTAAGARLGWMTGLWIFLVVVVICAFTAVYVANPQGWDALKEAWSRMPQTANLNLSQHDFLVQMLIELPFCFFLLTLLPGLGGMLGAKLSARKRAS